MSNKKIKDITRLLPKFLRQHSLWILAPLLLTGCGMLKKAAIVSSAAGIGSAAGSLLGGGGVIAPVAGAVVATGIADIATGTGEQTVGECNEAITGFWPLLGQVIETGGWLLAGIILIPLIMGFLIPNGLERKAKKKR